MLGGQQVVPEEGGFAEKARKTNEAYEVWEVRISRIEQLSLIIATVWQGIGLGIIK